MASQALSLEPGSRAAAPRSLGGRPWRLRSHDPRRAEDIMAALGLAPTLAAALAGRGVRAEDARAFLAPKLKDALEDPSALDDLDRAAARFADGIEKGERLGVLADYDVDGATSCALMVRFWRFFGLDAVIDVPDRLAEGYGPNRRAFDRLAAAGADLVATVDGGAVAFDAIAYAAERGQEVIVLDHHAGLERLPPALAVVNPNRHGADHPGFSCLAAVGVVFVTLIAVVRELKRRDPTRKLPDLRRFLDLVALGTVCDVVPLRGVNRAFVRLGVEVARRAPNPGMAALAREARLAQPIAPESFGFVLGPRINAGGRIGAADAGARLLIADDPNEAAALAVELEKTNAERRRIEGETRAAAFARAEAAMADDPPLLLAAGEGWHPGVIGIVASRLVERFHRPALVVALENGVGKGSGRSTPGFDLGAAILAARAEGLLAKGGGHAMAAGFEVAADKIAAFERFLVGRVRDAFDGGAPERPPLEIDARLAVGGARLDLARALDDLGPFGAEAPRPVLCVEGAKVVDARPVGRDHVQATVAGDDGARLSLIAFGVADAPLGQALLTRGAVMSLAGVLEIDRWGGRERAKLRLLDGALGDAPLV